MKSQRSILFTRLVSGMPVCRSGKVLCKQKNAPRCVNIAQSIAAQRFEANR